MSGPETVAERVEGLVPLLRERAFETEAARRVPEETIDALTEAGVFRLTTPKHFGGYESDLQTVRDVLATIARGCPSTSWVCSVHAACTWWAGLFSDEAQDEVFATPDLRVAAVLAATGKGRRKPGGVVVDGRWSFNTGCLSAQWGGMAALVAESDGSITPMVALMPYSALTIVEDWRATGLAGTGSHTAVAEDVFVPDSRLLPVASLLTADYPSERNASNPYFRIPAVPFFIAASGGTALGIAQGAMELFLERLPGRAITYTNYASQAEAPITHSQVAQAAMKIESADHHTRRANEIVHEYAGREFPVAARAQVRMHVSYATLLAREAVDMLFTASGATAIMDKVPIQLWHRDIEALALHAFLQPTTNFELYGRILCGLEPNTLFL